MHSKKYSIKLLNKTFDIMCQEDSFIKLQESAKKLNQNLLAVKKSSKHLTEYQILLMAALNLSAEFISYKEDQEQIQTHLDEFIKNVANKKINTLQE